MDKKVYIVYGSPCSGKNTYVKNVLNFGDLVVDMDAIYQCIGMCGMHEQPKELVDIAFGMRDYLMDCVKKRFGKWETAYIIGGFPSYAKRKQMCFELDAADIYIKSTQEECLHRLREHPDGRDVSRWEAYIAAWWRDYECGDETEELQTFNNMASAFYHSSKWLKTRRKYIAYRQSVDGGVCERCRNKVGYIVHHKEHLTIDNITDVNITLDDKNFELLCKECHDKEPGHWEDRFIQLKKAIWQKQRQTSKKMDVMFDSSGQPMRK